MGISKEDVLHIAKLSRLEVKDGEEVNFIEHFNKMLDNFKKLENIDTDNIKPTVHVIEKTNVLREDIACSSMDTEKLIANAPEKEDGAYLVPKVVD